MLLISIRKYISHSHFLALNWVGGIILIVAACITIVSRFNHIEVTGVDYPTYYYASENLIYGDSIYAIPNLQTPILIILFVPFALLPFSTSIRLFALLLIPLYLSCLWILKTNLKINLPQPQMVFLVGVLLVWYPFVYNLSVVPISLIVVWLLLFAWSMDRRGNHLGAGAVIGIACLIKLFPGLMIFYFLLRRRFKSIVSFCFVILIGGLISLAMVGLEDVVLYVSHVIPSDTSSYMISPANFSVAGVVSKLFVSSNYISPLYQSPTAATIVQIVLSGFIFFLYIFDLRQLPDNLWGDDIAYAISPIAMLLLSPVSWQHFFPILLLPFGLILIALMRKNIPQLRILFLITFIFISLPDLLIGLYFIRMFDPNPMPWYLSFILVLPTAGLALLWQLMRQIASHYR